MANPEQNVPKSYVYISRHGQIREIPNAYPRASVAQSSQQTQINTPGSAGSAGHALTESNLTAHHGTGMQRNTQDAGGGQGSYTQGNKGGSGKSPMQRWLEDKGSPPGSN
ncbi:hypothetical protein BCR34DRAFT_587609 [Clohesyomyces aquaticus]|uniref:Uncharacterized protein n=1 Tax=Clohesyomyces aquaticus TaxID=1231657 RepID=A0A1Y1ZNU9_9PLEO|nr:hypothetical protein BCR34DRAFT_587609 [Clohesyomyces aquaticus]